MKSLMKTRVFAVAAAVAGALLVAGTAQALDVNTTGYSLNGSTITGTVPNPANPPAPDSGGGGLFTFTRAALPGSAPALVPGATPADKFIGICLEFNETLTAGVNSYDLKSLDAAPISANGSLPGGMGTDKANHIATLLTTVFPDFGDTTFNNATNIAALQIAIWEIVHETDKLSGQFFYDPRSSSTDKGQAFWSDPGAAVTQAWNWLTVLNTTIASNPGALVNAATSSFRAIVNKEGDSQDFIVQLRSDAPPVPIPAAAWLLGSGLLGLFGLGRRRQKTTGA